MFQNMASKTKLTETLLLSTQVMPTAGGVKVTLSDSISNYDLIGIELGNYYNGSFVGREYQLIPSSRITTNAASSYYHAGILALSASTANHSYYQFSFSAANEIWFGTITNGAGVQAGIRIVGFKLM